MVRLAVRSSTSWLSPALARSACKWAIALAACPALVAAPLAAQDISTTPALEDLIPDEAVADPESWAQRGVTQEAAAQEDAPPDLDPDSPLAELPEIDIPWPDDIELEQLAPLEAEDDIEFVTFEDELPFAIIGGDEERISDELVLVFPTEQSLFPERPEFIERFRALSTIQQLEDDDSIGRLSAQARADEELLQQMLRVYGYYDAQVIRTVGGIAPGAESAAGNPSVRFDILPGVQYRFGAIELGNLASAGPDYPLLRETFEIDSGDKLLLDKIVEEQFDLDYALGESGYPFAAIDEPELLVDHARDEGDLTMLVTPGGKYNFGNVISNLPDFLSGRHLANIARFEPGETYQRSLELDLRRAILATGLVASAQLTPVVTAPPANGEPGTVDMQVELTEAKLRTIAGAIGYGTGEGFKVEGSWEHRNLFPPEGMLRVRGIAGTREQLLGVTFRKNNFKARDRILTVDAFASTIDYRAYDSRTVSLVGKYERVSTLLFQKPFSWSGGFELVATSEAERDANGNLGPRKTFFVAALPGFAQIDTSDDLLDPTEGFRVSGMVSPEISRTNGMESFYVRNQVDASIYRQMSEGLVLAARTRVASIPGAPIEAIAPSRRLYAGGGSSVRGYGYRAIGPQNAQGDPIGGRSLVEFSLEARIRTGLLDGALGIVPFFDAGTVGSDSTPSFDQIKYGVGIGARYHTGFGPLRLDVAVPLNPGPEDGWIAVYVALGQAF